MQFWIHTCTVDGRTGMFLCIYTCVDRRYVSMYHGTILLEGMGRGEGITWKKENEEEERRKHMQSKAEDRRKKKERGRKIRKRRPWRSRKKRSTCLKRGGQHVDDDKEQAASSGSRTMHSKRRLPSREPKGIQAFKK